MRGPLLRAIALHAAVVLVGAFLIACDGDGNGGGDDSGNETPRPAGVPETAQLVTEDFTVGSRESDDGSHLFFSSSCNDDVVNIVTTDVVIYAELPCDRALPAQTAQRFLGKAAEVRATISESKLYLDSAEAGFVEFTVGRIWRQTP